MSNESKGLSVTTTTLTRRRNAGRTLVTITEGARWVEGITSDNVTFDDVRVGFTSGNHSRSKSAFGIFSYNEMVDLLLN